MLRLVAFTSILLAAIQGDPARSASVLHIRVSIVAADQRPVPVARHALLISDNPATAAPRRVVTAPDGTAAVTLRAGNYTVESDRPAVLQGRAYQWTQVVDIAAGRDATLELTAANAEVGPATAEMEAAAAPAPASAEAAAVSPLFAKWQGSVVALWTERRHAGGVIVSDKGLVATSLSGIGDATSVEVQLSAADKVAGQVLATDPAFDVAIVRIDPAAATHAQPVPLACGLAGTAGFTSTQELLTIDVPLFGPKSATSGGVIKPGAQVVEADFALAASAAGGPVFAGDGPAVGLTSIPETGGGPGQVRVVPASVVCGVLASAERRLAAAAAPPSAARLPVESPKPRPIADMTSASSARGFSLSPYSSSSSDFDILFITPVLLAAAESQRGRTDGANDTLSGLRAVTEFGEWSEYVSQSPPVLFIRATPKLVEGFWMKFARGAASTQGAQIPPIKHVGPGFSRMRVLCGGKEAAPIHPFRIRARVSETDAVDEGFYVFDPAAIGPQCGTVSLVLSSMKNPDKTETKVVDAGVIAQVWKDFAAYR
jgi:hypothetical protein